MAHEEKTRTQKLVELIKSKIPIRTKSHYNVAIVEATKAFETAESMFGNDHTLPKLENTISNNNPDFDRFVQEFMERPYVIGLYGHNGAIIYPSFLNQNSN